MGKGGSTQASPYEARTAQASNELWELGQGLRNELQQKYANVLGGNYDFRNDPTYAAQYNTGKQALESQYQVARNNILANTVLGGNRDKQLANVEIARAGDVASMPLNLQSSIVNDLLSQANSVAWQTPQISLSGLSGATNSYGNRMAMQMAANNAGKAGLGGGLGQMAGMYAGTKMATKPAAAQAASAIGGTLAMS